MKSKILAVLLAIVIGATSSDEEHTSNINSELYQQLYRSIYKNMIEEDDHSYHVILRRNGLFLNPAHYDIPTSYKTANTLSLSNNKRRHNRLVHMATPPRITQLLFDLTDVIPNITNWIDNPETNNNRLSLVYADIIHTLLEHIQYTSKDLLQNIYNFLKEPLPEPEVTHPQYTGSNQTLRLFLYHRYKQEYYQARTKIEEDIILNLRTLKEGNFHEWYKENANYFNNLLKDEMYKWEHYGEKNEVEDWTIACSQSTLTIKNILSAKQQFESHRQPAWDEYGSTVHDDSNVTYMYEVHFVPKEWRKYLSLKYNESNQQLNHKVEQNEKKLNLLVDIRDKIQERYSSKEYYKKYRAIKRRYKQHKMELIKIVMKRKYNTMMCKYTSKKKFCNEATQLREVVEKLQKQLVEKHIKFQSYRSPLPKYGSFILKAVGKEINNTIDSIKKLQSDMTNDTTSIPIVNYYNSNGTKFFKFRFRHHKEDGTELPKNRKLWYLNKTKRYSKVNKTISEYLDTVEEYLNSITDQTSLYVNIIKLDIKRHWFNQTLFSMLNKSTFTEAEFLVSPGPQNDPHEFRKVVTSDKYLLPFYTSSLLLATDIRIKLPKSLPTQIRKKLVALSYEPLITGGIGIFTFGHMIKTKGRHFKFRIELTNSNYTLLHIPGSQLIGYICHIIDKFP